MAYGVLVSVVYFCMTVLSHILPIFSSEKNLYRMSVRGMLVNERAARPLEEEVGRNPVACDTGRGNLCPVGMVNQTGGNRSGFGLGRYQTGPNSKFKFEIKK